MDRPIFIVGANRSGTTLLRLILNAHSRIAVPEEILYFRSRIGNRPIEDWRDPLDEEQYARIARSFIERVEIPDLDREEVLRLIARSRPNLKSPYQVLMDYWAKTQGKMRWGEKTPGNLFYADIIAQMFPDAYFIHMVRDPRAGVYSMERVWFFPEDVVFNALSRHKHMTEGRKILENAADSGRIMTIRYEDLVNEPVEMVRRVCDFIEEDFEEQMMEYHKGADRHMRSDAAADFNVSATMPVTTKKKDSWKEALSDKDVQAIELISQNEMKEFGYGRTSDSVSPAVRLHVWVKKLYWKRQEQKNRHNRHFTVRYKMFSGIKRRIGRLLPRTETA